MDELLDGWGVFVVNPSSGAVQCIGVWELVDRELARQYVVNVQKEWAEAQFSTNRPVYMQRILITGRTPCGEL